MPINKTGVKKDGKQQYRVRVNYTDREGKSNQVERIAYGLPEARELEAKLRDEYTSGDKSTLRMTVEELIKEYLKAKKNEVRATTFDKTRRNMERYIIPELGKVRLDRLGVQRLQEWKTLFSDKDLAFRSKQNIYKELSTLFNYAVRLEYMPKNPLKSIGNFKEVYFEKPAEKLNYYTAAEFLSFISAAKSAAEASGDWRYYVFFNVAFYTGMRKGEINALKWSDIDGDIIHVRRSIAQKLKGEDVETPPKNKSSYRDLQIPIPLKNILDEHKKRQSANAVNFSNNYRVCGGESCLRDSSIENFNQRFAKAAKLKHIRIHDFRHTHASLLVNEGINIQEIARRLGHSKIEITWNTYSHLYPREEERAVAILNKIA
ncbi:putative defective protein IntQ [bioreactor metagenome]|uniref:Putative defective protein IntQ n=1 Tax=bioreactor metagenome TaxID=1076179 RepID=A0A645AUK2_9ZZZZ|nr:tyrosine-type recombinase/integrase [Oscillospiraceae bacterium]